MSRLETLHPYPAMVASELACQLANGYVSKGARVLDPFCGSGRFIMSTAAKGGEAFGIDINPLATLITSAKAAHLRPAKIADLIVSSRRYRTIAPSENYDLQNGRLVEWFSDRARRELCQILSWMNDTPIEHSEMLLLATVLSATVRLVSYASKKGWKLHRRVVEHKKGPWDVFTGKVSAILSSIGAEGLPAGKCTILNGDVREAGLLLARHQIDPVFDLVLTSPPYGDSRTTVQYGGISSLCLCVLSNIEALGIAPASPSAIDNACLGGGRSMQTDSSTSSIDVTPYWLGDTTSRVGHKVAQFLCDMRQSCTEVGRLVRGGGRLIFVVGRRSVGQAPLYLDSFIQDEVMALGTSVESSWSRDLGSKYTPSRVNRYARRRTERHLGDIPTMKEEYVLVFRKL